MLIRRWLASLVNRAVAFVVCAIVLSAMAVTLVSVIVSRSELEAQARAQVETIAGLVAGNLDARLAQRRDTLAHVAQGLAMAEQELKARASLLIQREIALQHQFDGIYLFDTEGTVIAEYPEEFRQKGLNVSDREYFRNTSNQLTPIISEPYVSNYQDQPAIMVTAPVFDHRQRFIGVLGGAVLLTGNNFMRDISDIRIGETGYVGLATRNGVTLAHGRTGEAMVPLRVENPVLRDAMSGFEGTRRTVNQPGAETIMSVRQMSQVPWFVAAVWPTAEAYAPVSRLTNSTVQVLLVIMLLVTPVALLVFRRLMVPLRNLGFQISERHLGIRSEPVDVAGGSEIRQVAETFNTVMEERDEVLASLAEREAFFRSLTQSAPIGIIQTDVLGRIEFVNPAFEQIIGIDASELLHTPLIAGVHDEDRAAAMSDWRGALRNNLVFRGRFRLKTRKKRHRVWAEVMTTVIGTDERTLGTVTVVRDITRELEIEAELAEKRARADSERRREEQRLSWEATHDSLTGLLNRRAFNVSLMKCLADAGSQAVASVLVLIDLDYFKPVNDQGGHLTGDDLLGRLAGFLKKSVRQSDTVARLGGDEFGIILPACGAERAAELAEDIRLGIESIRIEQNGQSFGVTASIGLTEMSETDASPREVMARADEGAYAAKARGRNQVVTVPLSSEERPG